jgi:ATP-dependent DNA ligase
MIQPMLAQKAEHPQSGEEWLAELKLDGIRLLYSTDGGRLGHSFFREQEHQWE